MSSLYYIRLTFLLSVVLLVRAKETSNTTHSEEQDCSDKFCDAHFDGDSHAAEEHLRGLCEPACEEGLEIALRVAHLNYDHVEAAFGTSILIIVVIFAKLCK